MPFFIQLGLATLIRVSTQLFTLFSTWNFDVPSNVYYLGKFVHSLFLFTYGLFLFTSEFYRFFNLKDINSTFSSFQLSIRKDI